MLPKHSLKIESVSKRFLRTRFALRRRPYTVTRRSSKRAQETERGAQSVPLAFSRQDLLPGLRDDLLFGLFSGLVCRLSFQVLLIGIFLSRLGRDVYLNLIAHLRHIQP
jgi:hypothetical protein